MTAQDGLGVVIAARPARGYPVDHGFLGEIGLSVAADVKRTLTTALTDFFDHVTRRTGHASGGTGQRS